MDDLRTWAASLPKHSARAAAVNQTGPDRQRAVVQRDFFDLQFRPAVKRPATVIGADGGKAGDFFDARRARRLENFSRPFHIHRANFLPAQRLEVIRAMNERGHSGQHWRGNFRAQLKRHRPRAGLRPAGQFQNFPAARREEIFEAAADVTAGAGDRANRSRSFFVYRVAHVITQPR